VTELSVVLVNHNGADCLPKTLLALAPNTATEDVECLVVDSGSADGSWEGVEGIWEKARSLRFEENIGFCAGCNRGAEVAQGRLLAFVNFDGEVEPDWDAPLRQLLDDPAVAIATGVLLTGDGGESKPQDSRSPPTRRPTDGMKANRVRHFPTAQSTSRRRAAR